MKWAHPRAYGENLSLTLSEGARLGSSPRIRGKHGCELIIDGCHGLIPAHTGKTLRFPPVRRARRGSSPRIRGKPCSDFGTHTERGLIPAHTGKTNSAYLQHRSCRAHPRAYGENADALARRLPHLGSSPRIRGKLDDPEFILGKTRLIPAHTGKSLIRSSVITKTAAHPRAYGENTS